MHILQSPFWNTFKSQTGWHGTLIQLPHAQSPTQLLFRPLPLGLKLAYVPKGPTLDWQNTTISQHGLQKLIQAAQLPGVIFLKIEPDIPRTANIAELLLGNGFQPGKTIQPPATILVDLSPAEADILAAMKSKTRYNIRLAARKGVSVREGTAADLTTFHQLSEITAQRDNFGVHALSYYQTIYQLFPPENRALLIAESDGEPLAALMVFAWDGVGYYLYGASSNAQRNKMPAYLLQWEAMRWAKAHGCHTYDLWGVPDAPAEQLEREFTNRSDGLWGVYRFKRGFGGTLSYSIGAYDFVYAKPIYLLFNKILAARSR